MVWYLSALAERFRRDERGATAVEYSLMVALVAVVIIGAVVLLGGNVKGVFDGAAGEVGAS